MKLKALTFTALIALTGTASANWFDGFNNGNGNANGYGNLTGNGQGAGNTAANATGNGNTAGNFAGNGTSQTTNNGYGSSMPWGNNNAYVPAAYNQQPNMQQVKAMWEAQRKQAEEMLKQIEAANKVTAK